MALVAKMIVFVKYIKKLNIDNKKSVFIKLNYHGIGLEKTMISSLEFFY